MNPLLIKLSPIVLFIACGILSCKHVPLSGSSDPALKVVEHLSDSAKMHYTRGHTELAIQYYKRALQHAQNHKLPQHQAQVLLKMAKILPRQDIDVSLSYLDSALRIAKTIHHYQLQSDIYRSIAEIHKQHHNYTAALFALEAHNLLTDSLLDERRNKNLQHLAMKKDALRERVFYILVAAILLGIALALALFFRRTKKLNRELTLAVDVRNKLFSIISHDLRGPAGSLKLAYELLETGAISDEEFPGFFKMLKNQSNTLNETLDSLLIWSRSQLDEIRTVPLKFVLLESIKFNLALLEGQYTIKQLKINISVPIDMEIYADKDQFDFIIRNLLSNAIKFSYAGSAIEVTAERKKDSILLTVTDHGIGISPERQAQFQSGTLETTFGTSGEKGTGLGLRMIKDFVSASGGNISLQSTKGNTQFSLSLPPTPVIKN